MRTERKLFIAIVGVKIIFLALFVLFFGSAKLIWSDSTTYLELGQSIFSGRGFSSFDPSLQAFVPNGVRTPLYPFVVGFFDRFLPFGMVFVSLLQAFAAGGIAVYTYRIAQRFLSVFWSIVTAVVVSIEPLTAVIHLLILPEAFLLLFLLVFAYHFLRFLEKEETQDVLLAFFFLAVSVYTKPVALYLVAVPVLVLVLMKKFRAVIMGVFLLVLLFSPWVLRNYFALGRVDMTIDDSNNICSWELTAVLGTKYGTDPSDWNATMSLPERRMLESRCRGTVQALTLFATEYTYPFIKTTVLSTASLLTNEGYTALFERPAHEQIKVHHNYLTPAVFSDYDWRAKIAGAVREFSGWELSIILFGKTFWLLVTVGAFFGAMSLLRRNFSEGLFLVLYVLYFIAATVLSTGYGVGARLRYPIVPFLLIFFVIFLVRFFSLDKRVEPPVLL